MAATNPTVEIFYSGGWHDITATNDVRVADPITITRGRPNESQVMPPSTLNLTIDNTDGKYSPRNPASPLYGLIGRNTPIRVSVGGVSRFYGEVEAWPQRWNVKGSDVWTPITANGILRRLNAPGTSRPAQSALRRAILAGSPIAYWPLEDLQGATVLGAAAGGPVLTPLSATLSLVDSPWAGSPTVLDISVQGGNPLSATLAATTGTAWSLSFIVQFDNTPAATFFPLKVIADDWQLFALNGLGNAIGSFVDSTGGLADVNASHTFSNGEPHHVVITATQSGSDVAITLRVDGVQWATNTITGKTLPMPTGVVVNPGPALSGDDVNYLGHVAIFDYVYTADLSSAADAYTGETADGRIHRLCTEENVTFALIGVISDTELMGPQRIAPIIDLWNDAVSADGGILYESRGEFGISYRTHTSLYNQTAVLTARYSAGGEVAPPLEPVEDTDHVANDVTVTRADGSSSRAVQETGPLNVQEPSNDPDGVGRYSKDVTLNLYQDKQALQQAAWMRHIGTWDEARYPVVNFDLTAMGIDGKTSLLSSVANLDIGDRFSVTGMPAWVPPDSLEQRAQGYVETIESHRWAISVNATPALPYDVLQLETDVTHNLSRIPTAGSTLAGTMTTTSTSRTVSSVGRVWIDSATYGAQFPFDIIVAGERMTVTAIVGTTSPQTFTVTRSVNGVVKAHASGEDVQLFRPPVIAR